MMDIPTPTSTPATESLEAIVAPDDTRAIYAFSASSLNTTACFRQYAYYKRGLSPLIKKSSLEEGDLLHRLLESYYRQKVSNPAPEERLSPTDIIADVSKRHRTDYDMGENEVQECYKQFTEYCIYYAGEGWNPLLVEAPFTRLFYEDEKYVLIFEGKIDLLVETAVNPKVIVDHKKVGRNGPPPYRTNQNLGYCWAFGTDKILINQVGFQKSLSMQERFVRPLLSYPEELILEWRDQTIQRMLQAVYFTELCGTDYNSYPYDLTSCDKFSGCAYKSICDSTPASREWTIERKFKVNPKHDIYVRGK